MGARGRQRNDPGRIRSESCGIKLLEFFHTCGKVKDFCQNAGLVRRIGKGVRSFRQGMNDISSEINTPAEKDSTDDRK